MEIVMINWKKLYEVYTRSGVNKSSFYRNHLPGYFEDGESLPTLSELYEQFALIEQKSSRRVQGPTSKLVKVIDRYQPVAIEEPVEEPVEEPSIRASVAPDPAQIPNEKVELQLELPNGVRLTFSTATPEKFALDLISTTVVS